MSTVIIKEDMIGISYYQVVIYDEKVESPGCDWTDEHILQGFARRDSTVSFGTFFHTGFARTKIFLGKPEDLNQFDRVISVPFEILSGKLSVKGPFEEFDIRYIYIDVGHYNLWCAQRYVDEENVYIEIYFEPVEKPALKSKIHKADAGLDPPLDLLETCDEA